MKRLLWTSAMALTAVACLTACDDSGSSSSNEIPTYKTEAALPDTCEMEVAKAGDTYFACFENKWVEVTDSATVEKIKEGLDEEDLKEELEDMMAKLSSSSKKPSSSSKKVESSDDEGNTEVESSSSEEECTGRRCKTGGSSSSKKSSGGSGNGGSGSGEGGESSSPSSAESSSPSSAESSSPSSAETSSPSSASSSSLKRNAVFSVIDDYVTWDEEGKTATIENTGSGTSLMAALKGKDFENEQVQSITVGAYNELLKMMGTDLSVGANYFVSTLLETKKDSAMYILTIPDVKVGTVINTFVVPMGKCGDYSYYKLTQFCDGRGEGTVYKYVTIGEQTWMAENLNYETASGSYCYDDDPDNCDIYGRLYTWVTAIDKTIDECGENKDCNLGSDDVQGVCPEGWHLPSKTEWEDLFTEVGGKTSAGNVLKSSGDNTYGFSALLGGNRQRTGGFELLGDYAQFWTATQAPNPVASYSISMFSSNDEAEVSTSWYKNRSLSVRCIKNTK